MTSVKRGFSFDALRMSMLPGLIAVEWSASYSKLEVGHLSDFSVAESHVYSLIGDRTTTKRACFNVEPIFRRAVLFSVSSPLDWPGMPCHCVTGN